MKIVVGSTAMEASNVPFRTPVDTDIWTDEEISIKGVDTKTIPTSILKMLDVSDGVHCSADDVYTIKCSHLGWNNPMWKKHKADILYLKMRGCRLKPQLFGALVSYWGKLFGNKEFLSLNQKKDEFFNDHVTYVYDHDWLHLQVSYPNRPTYEMCLKEGEDVLVDKALFEGMEFEDRVRMFMEEITVIAIERYLVNPVVKGRYSWYEAYGLALHKTITQLTKGWATSFIVCNLEHFKKPDYTYFKHALSVVNN